MSQHDWAFLASCLLWAAVMLVNTAVSVYAAYVKAEECQAHFVKSNLVKQYRFEPFDSFLSRLGSMGMVYSLLVFKYQRRLDPVAIEEVSTFPAHLRPWIVIPGHINLFCVAWMFAMCGWAKYTGLV
ncbi:MULTISPECIES: hypothetical protein [Pseudomonas]|uniref:hypothetical protein n=1 Tax=Pseudomonas TaxID=286 RepID=UPI0012B1D655|nr:MULTISPECIES: hypothetical protein [Pseudomonas]MSU92700.1 hypothetical protein [Pseudomonas mandelii]WNF53519.1 hypothetical protein RHP74_19420 [Pseudomonas sp. SG20052]